MATRGDFFTWEDNEDWKFVNCIMPDGSKRNDSNITISDLNLQGLDFSGLKFDGVTFSNCNLSYANLTNLSGIANVFSDKFILKLVHSKSSKVKYIGYLLNMLQSKNNSFNILRTGGWSSHMYGVYGGNAVFKEKFIQEEKRDIENFK